MRQLALRFKEVKQVSPQAYNHYPCSPGPDLKSITNFPGSQLNFKKAAPFFVTVSGGALIFLFF